ncbi:MAG TPA: hypothetical protein VK972_03800 [Wenzhouxiangella sp.]|nr:hypothetical protein [Wenzhouxiangella sp.]
MDTDSYTPAISFEKLLRLARKYGPEALAEQALPSDQGSRQQVEQAVCPCVRGEPCVVEAVADELERMTRVFRQQQHELKPDGAPKGKASLLDDSVDDAPPDEP